MPRMYIEISESRIFQEAIRRALPEQPSPRIGRLDLERLYTSPVTEQRERPREIAEGTQ